MSMAQERLGKTAGLHSPHPEVPAPILRRDIEILGVGQVGSRVNKYGVQGLKLLFEALGDVTKVEAVKTNAQYIGRGVASLISVVGLLMLRGRASRELAFGACWENLTSGIDFVEEQVRKAAGI